MTTPKMHTIACPNPKNLLGKGGIHHMAWYEWGNATDKPIICVHGLSHNGHYFDILARHLVTQGYRVICPDIAGRGKSDWLENPKNYGYPLYCADMLHLMQEQQLTEVDWLGTSMGGLIGMMIAASQPQRINRMILNDVGSFIPKDALMRIGNYLGKRIHFNSLEDGENYLRNIMTSFGIWRDEHWKYIASISFIREAGGHYHIAYDPAIALAFRDKNGKVKKMPDMDFSKLWQAITCPMLVLRGEESDLLLKSTAETMAQRNGVMLIEFPNVGHAPMLLDSHQIEPVLAWLADKQTS